MLVAFDCETTGFTTNHIVELAAVITMDSGEQYEWYSLMKPSTPVEDGAAAIHNLTNAMLANERPDTVVVAEWWKDICDLRAQTGENLVLSGHNVAYDMRAVRKYVEIPMDMPTLCTMKLARVHHPNAPDHKLTTMHGFLKLQGQYNAHSALDDVYMHGNILRYYIDALGVNYYQLAQDQCKPRLLKTMPFGKWKGSGFDVIDTSYFKYMLGLSDVDADVRYSMQEELNRRTLGAKAW